MIMNDGSVYYFFRLDHFKDDPYPEFRVARSYSELVSRFGHLYISSFFDVVRLNEVTSEHIQAIDELLNIFS